MLFPFFLFLSFNCQGTLILGVGAELFLFLSGGGRRIALHGIG
jgi:hypothetical protein